MPNASPNLTVTHAELDSERAHASDLVDHLPSSENKRFYPALDGLRAVAVLMVFWQHYSSGTSFARNFRWGWTGVDVFFVLSGFLITGILYDTRHDRFRFRNFYIRRTLRIFPLYYAVFLCALILYPVFHWVWHPIWILWPLYLGNFGRFIWLKDYLTNPLRMDHLVSLRPMSFQLIVFFGHFWSLCIEEQFYLVWPLAVFYIKDRIRLRNMCAFAMILCLTGRSICEMTVSPALLGAGFLERFTPLRVDSLLLGGLLALALRGPEALWVRRLGNSLFPAILGVTVVLQVLSLLLTHHALDLPISGTLIFTVGYTVIDLLAGSLLLNAIEPQSLSFRVLNQSWLRKLGQMSYGFYIFHDILHVTYLHWALMVVSTRTYLFQLVMLFGFVGTLILSYLSFRFFEAPFLRLKDRFTA